MVVLGLTVAVQADILRDSGVESGFEVSADDGYGSQISEGFGVWTNDTNWDNIDHEVEYTSNTGITAHSGNGYWKLAGNAIGGTPYPVVGSAKVNAVQNEPYTFSCWVKIDPANPPSKVEFGFDQYNGGNWQGNDIITITPTAEWQYFEYSTTCWNNSIAPKIAPFGRVGQADGVIYTDDWKLVNPNLVGQAYNPNPAEGEEVPLNLAALSWNNPDPRKEGDTISCSVYLSQDPNNLDLIASNVTDGMVDLAGAGVTLNDNGMPYYWRVDSLDPNTPGPAIVTPSEVWTFVVGDVPAVVDAGADQYNWIYMPDGDGDPAKVTFTVMGSYTDDGKSTISRAEWVQGTHEGGGTVTKVSETWTPGEGSGTVEATFSATGSGWLFLTLEVEDESGVGSDTMNVGVYGTCIEAAREDPNDDLGGRYPNGHGDINGDCQTNLEDFAILAGSWLECMTVKAGCIL